MVESRYAKSHRELIVYRKARLLAQEIFAITKAFPREEIYSLTDQIRRASRSVGAQIAEAWAKRPYERHFVSKLTDADAEQHETQHWIETAEDCGYISRDQAAFLLSLCSEIGKLIGSMIEKSSSFCKPTIRSLRELQAAYFI